MYTNIISKRAAILQKGNKAPFFTSYLLRRSGNINFGIDWNENKGDQRSKGDQRGQALRKFRQPTGESTFSSIKKAYTISDSQLMGIERFLDKHKDIADLVLEAHAKIRDFFTSETLLLELISDISIEGG